MGHNGVRNGVAHGSAVAHVPAHLAMTAFGPPPAL
jgi:hypothetical protein